MRTLTALLLTLLLVCCSADPLSVPDDMCRETLATVTLDNVKDDMFVYVTLSDAGLIDYLQSVEIRYSWLTREGMSPWLTMSGVYHGKKEIAFPSGYLFPIDGGTMYLPTVIEVRVIWFELEVQQGGGE